MTAVVPLARVAAMPPRLALAPGSTGKNRPVARRSTFSASRVTPLSLYYEFNGTSGTEPNLVTVSYTTTTGTGSFDAIKFTLYSTSHYFPINGHDDLSTITAITGEVDSGIPVDGQTYAAFGLSKNQIDVTGTSADDMLIGDISNDKLSGLAGNDVMFGDIGEDKMLGAGGKDKMYGGAGNDELLGGGGGDTMHGGIGDDTLDGGGAKDKMWGDAGDDVLRDRFE